VANCGVVENSHPPFSPDLAPADFFLFLKVKTALKGRRLQGGKGLKMNVIVGLVAVVLDALSDCFFVEDVCCSQGRLLSRQIQFSSYFVCTFFV
jgi:hypothetical protein